MIITTAITKTILGITGSDYDTQIAALIPYVQEDVIAICNPGYTKDENIYVDGITIAFTNTDPDTITDSDSGFVDAGFEGGHDIVVEDSESNDGVYNVDTVTAGVLTLDSSEELTTESAGEDITITRIKWEKENLFYIAKMIWYCIKHVKDFNVKSESLSRYNVTYEDIVNGYPKSIISGFKNRNVRMK